jgi:hypothetical protein
MVETGQRSIIELSDELDVVIADFLVFCFCLSSLFGICWSSIFGDGSNSSGEFVLAGVSSRDEKSELL